jgi:type II secretory pathway component PulC
MNKKNLIFILIIILSFIISTSVFAENINEKIYSGKEFRNPFTDTLAPKPETAAGSNEATNVDQVNQRPVQPQLTFADIKNQIPFSLNGIISSNRERVALLNTGVNVELIRGNYQKDGYKIIAIEKDSVIVENRGFKLRLKIGGEIDEI